MEKNVPAAVFASIGSVPKPKRHAYLPVKREARDGVHLLKCSFLGSYLEDFGKIFENFLINFGNFSGFL